MNRTLIAALLLSAAAAVTAPAQAADRNASFGVSLRIAATGAPLAAPQLPMPAGSQRLAATGANRYDVMDGGVAASRDYFLATLPGAGYALQAQREDNGRWQSLWRSGAGTCTEIVAEPVVGAAVARVQSRSLACA